LCAIAEHGDAGTLLANRGIDPVEVATRDLARELDDETEPHRGCRWTQRTDDGEVVRVWSWYESTHRIVLPVWDASGNMASVRGWATVPNVERCGVPKRLPLAGFSSAGLCLANAPAVHMLRTREPSLLPVVVVEGEPDFVVWSTRHDGPVFGVGSGWWTQTHGDRIPSGARVAIRTHRDKAGERYARDVAATLGGRCRVERLTSK
jgi:hypothetical protein